MSNEITVTGAIKASKNSVEINVQHALKQFDMSGGDMLHRTQIIGSTEEAVNLGEVGTPGWAMFYNRGPTDTISLRAATGAADFCKMAPGEFAGPFKFSATAPFAISSSTNSPVLESWIAEA